MNFKFPRSFVIGDLISCFLSDGRSQLAYHKKAIDNHIPCLITILSVKAYRNSVFLLEITTIERNIVFMYKNDKYHCIT